MRLMASFARSFRMFEFNMDEYLDEEIDWVKDAMSKICKDWDSQVRRVPPFPLCSSGLF